MERKDQELLINKIRAQYMEQELTGQEEGLKKLQELDREVKRPVNTFSYVFGTISALVMGAGMSLIMTPIGERFGEQVGMPLGIVIGVIGLVMAIVNYPIYKKKMAARQKKYADQIIALSDELLNHSSNF